ncbi:uncharacterized protein METZ01_LOCUS232010, partial [marine metagenome]
HRDGRGCLDGERGRSRPLRHRHRRAGGRHTGQAGRHRLAGHGIERRLAFGDPQIPPLRPRDLQARHGAPGIGTATTPVEEDRL